mmetsp:Transcript_7504/g.11144  ORF Transcript_7504/g.11144 Transcript_7504/m.11144 type:complete len:795 (-) Transcript_7504:176-2560(-)
MISRSLTLLLLVCLCVCGGVGAIRSRSSWDGLFRSNSKAKFSSESHFSRRQRSFINSLERSEKYPFIVQLREKCGGVCHNEIEQALVRRGFHYSIINSDHALAHADINYMRTLLSAHSETVLDMVPFLPELKVDRDLNIDSLCSNRDGMVSLSIVFLPMSDRELDFLVSHLRQLGPKYTLHKGDIEGLRVNSENIITLNAFCEDAEEAVVTFSNMANVQWIEQRHDMVAYSRYANGVVQSGNPDLLPMYAANLTGRGHIIGIGDTGLDGYSCFFYDPDVEVPYDVVDESHRKIVYYYTYQDDIDENGHGTTVVGTALGKCRDVTSDNAQYDGAAFDAKVAFMDMGNSGDATIIAPSNYYDGIYQVLYNRGAVIQSMSWGSESSAYTTQARYVDRFMWDNKDCLILTAAGNSGADGESTVGSPATNKNGVAVGASLNDETYWFSVGKASTSTVTLDKSSLAEFSSRGPTDDGRLKPEICAVGKLITNAHAEGNPSSEHCSVETTSGTSFSTPLLAGYAVVVRQYFMDGWYPSGTRRPELDGFNPSGALVKAMLTHGGQALRQINDGEVSSSTTWGDDNQGYGRAQLNAALSFSNSTLDGLSLFVLGSASSSEPHYVEMTTESPPHTYTFTTQDIKKLSAVRVTLSYTDYFGTVGASNALVNDLDLTVSNDTHTFYPLVTNSGGQFDRRNNHEFVIIEYPARNASYTVTVTGHSLSRTQPYALVISGEIGEYEYEIDKSEQVSGLSDTARIIIGTMAGFAFCFTACVFWIAFASPTRRVVIREAKEFERQMSLNSK